MTSIPAKLGLGAACSLIALIPLGVGHAADLRFTAGEYSKLPPPFFKQVAKDHAALHPEVRMSVEVHQRADRRLSGLSDRLRGMDDAQLFKGDSARSRRIRVA